jgi:hypothetical protein
MRISIHNVVKVSEKINYHSDFITRDIIIEDENQNITELYLFAKDKITNVMSYKIQKANHNA